MSCVRSVNSMLPDSVFGVISISPAITVISDVRSRRPAVAGRILSNPFDMLLLPLFSSISRVRSSSRLMMRGAASFASRPCGGG